MKANEAPEKIYLSKDYKTNDVDERWFDYKSSDDDIEYIRTNAFIKKAEKYLTEKLIKDVSVLAGGVVSINFDAAISNFVKYMEGKV